MHFDKVKHTEKHAVDVGRAAGKHRSMEWLFSPVRRLHEPSAGVELVAHHEAVGFM